MECHVLLFTHNTCIIILIIQIIWKRLYNTLSTTDHGTLQQLRDLINRRNVISEPGKDVNACEDFLLLVVKCYVICAALNVFNMDTIESFPENVENEWNLESKDERRCKLYSLAEEIVAQFVDLSAVSDSKENQSISVDHINEYSKELLSLGLLYMEYQDAIREGDGDRYFMVLFKVTNHRNYATEAFITLAECDWFLPQRQAMQLKYSRFINIHGRPGCNVPCDLYMEHINRLVKICIQHLGANKTERAIQRIGRCIGPIDEILYSYDEENGVSPSSITHNIPSLIHDRDCIIRELRESKVFAVEHGREYRHFKTSPVMP